MKGKLLHTVWCNIFSREAAGEIWNWSLFGVKGIIWSANCTCFVRLSCRYRLTAGTSEKIQLGSLIAAFQVARDMVTPTEDWFEKQQECTEQDWRLVYTYDASTSISHVWTGMMQAQAQEKGMLACACACACVVCVSQPWETERIKSFTECKRLTDGVVYCPFKWFDNTLCPATAQVTCCTAPQGLVYSTFCFVYSIFCPLVNMWMVRLLVSCVLPTQVSFVATIKPVFYILLS